MDDHHSHSHPSRTMLWAIAITLGFAGVEAFGGWISHSLALLGDAGHMLTDSSALGLAAFAAWLMHRPPSQRHSYGLVRAEVIAALINSLLMLGIVASIVIAAIDRLSNPHPVTAGMVMGIAFIGLLVNIAVAWVLHRGEKNLNTRAALLHVMGDLLGSVAALVAGAVIWLTGWTLIDPLLSLLICALILISSLRLLREAVHVIMEGVPSGIDLHEVGTAMANVEGVASVHDLHVWTVSSGNIALSAHVMVANIQHWQPVLNTLQHLLHDRFDIEHTTIQPEPSTNISYIPADKLFKNPKFQNQVKSR
ncbi:MAG: cation transporter [Gammaproteobacteria bacterium]|nr:cation transporter [Gammaproteobacteria bacterium]